MRPALCFPERRMIVKKIISMLLGLLLLLSLSSAAFAEPSQSRVVIGADLSAQQVASVYKTFGLQRGQVVELKVNNAEERRLLSGFVDNSLIGTRSVSCVYVQLLPPGSGISVVTSNITWCTGQMYVSALSTAGITDARIVVTAPVPVSGTAALTGVYKAYENMTGTALADASKLLGMQELTVTGSLADAFGSVDSLAIVNDLKLMLDKTKDMSDDELRQTITEIAGRYGVNLNETQMNQLVSLCRSLENLDPSQLRERVQKVQDTFRRASEAKDKVVGFAENLKSFMESLSGFFDSLRSFFDRFS